MSTPVRLWPELWCPGVDSVQTMLSTNRLAKAATERSQKFSLSLRSPVHHPPRSANSTVAVNAMSTHSVRQNICMFNIGGASGNII